MKKFENAQLEIVKLNMVDIIATSCFGVACDNEGFDNAKEIEGGDWDED